MSDGNYNKNLLPYTQFQSGLRMGKIRMKQNACAVFAKWINDNCASWSIEEQKQALESFEQKLSKYV